MNTISPWRSLHVAARFILIASLLTATFSISNPQTALAGKETSPLTYGDSLAVQYISTGANHSCGLKQEGGIFCWGGNTYGQTNVPSIIPFWLNQNFIQVTAGANHTCALQSDFEVTCWGDNGSGQTNAPLLALFSQISAGGSHTCGRLWDSTIVCWGSNTDGQLDVPAPNSGFSHVSAGGSHTCGRRSDGTIECWGSNSDGQLDVPTPNTDFRRVVAGRVHTCGLKTDGSVVCWGSNASGQTDVPSPNAQFAHVSAGFNHTCGFKGNGSIVCWGSNGSGELNVPAPNSSFAQVSAGGGHSCGLKDDGRVVCWGDNSHYESDPFLDLTGWVSAGQDHSCLLRRNDTVFCWGNNRFGQSNLPSQNNDFDRVSAGGELSCGLKDDETMVCWGVDFNNQITVPAPNANFTQISTGYNHACGTKSDGSISCTSDYIWGDPPDDDFGNVGAGGEHSCGVTSDQSSILCWGYDTYGESSPPAPIDRWIEVSAGSNHTCGQNRIAGPAQCWGLNDFGQTNVPPPNDNFFTVSAGGRHSCAITVESWLIITGTITCWGDDSSGQGTVPTPNSNFLEVSAGGMHTCGTRLIDFWQGINQIKCWGDDTYGQSSLALTHFMIPPVNQPPTANDDSYNTLEDTTLTIDDTNGVLDNDTDPENDPLTAEQQSSPSYGSLTLNPDGSFEYDPNEDYCGSDSFTYLARTVLADSNTATVNIDVTCVNDEPSFSASDPPAVDEDAGLLIVLDWATFDPGALNESTQTVLQYIVSNVTNPSLLVASPTVDTSGDLYFTPAANAYGTTDFDVQVQDDGGTANGGDDTSPAQTFTITVNPLNDAPTTSGLGSLIVSEDTPGSAIDLWQDFDDLEDSDDELSFTVSAYTNPSLFSLVQISADRNLLLAYAPDENGSSDVTVRATDTGGLWVESTLAVTVDPVNDPPSFTAGGDVTVPMNSGAYSAPWASNISPGPANESGQTLTFHVSNDNGGLFSDQPAIASNGTLSFTPATNALGAAQVSVYLTDDGGTALGGDDTSPTVNFTITVAPFPTVTGVSVSATGVPILPGSIVVARMNRLTVTFDMDVDDPPGDSTIDDVTNPDNYMLLRAGPNDIFDTPDCAAGLSGDDRNYPSGNVVYDSATWSVRVWLNDGNILQDGDYRLHVCGTTSITADGIALGGDGSTSGTDYILDFSVVVPEKLPKTGFAPNVRTSLPAQPATLAFTDYNGLLLQIPRLKQSLPIVGVPLHDGSWDVRWLSRQAGWLHGTAFPTWAGNAVLTAHAVDPSGLPGPFHRLGELAYGDPILIHAWGQQYVFEVRSVWRVPSWWVSSVLRHETYPWLTLVTCDGYDPGRDDYRYRTIVRAVQVDIR